MKAFLRVACGSLALLLLTTGAVLCAGKGSSHDGKRKSAGWIGVVIQDVNRKTARDQKIDSKEGVFVKDVVDDSPADSAGIKEGDILLEFNGKKLVDADDLVKAVQKTPPGTRVKIVLTHERENKSVQLIVGKMKQVRHRMLGMMPSPPDVRVLWGNRVLGLQLLALNDQLGAYFGAPEDGGVLVEEVKKGSTADKAGFKAGDVILRVGKKDVDDPGEVRKQLGRYDEGDSVTFEILRKGSKTTLTTEIGQGESDEGEFSFPRQHMQMFRFGPFDDAERCVEMNMENPDCDCLEEGMEPPRPRPERKRNELHEEIGPAPAPAPDMLGL